jgi:hypothetical protein
MGLPGIGAMMPGQSHGVPGGAAVRPGSVRAQPQPIGHRPRAAERLARPPQVARQRPAPRSEVRQLALGRVHRAEHLDIGQHPPDGPLDAAERQRVAEVD